MGQDRRVDPVDTTGIMEGRFHPPGDLVASHRPAVTTQATVSVAANADGGKYVVTAFAFSVAAAVALTATTFGAFIIDGATGGTSYLWQAVLSTGSAGAQYSMSGLNLVGSANTAVTIEFSGAITSGYEAVCMSYHKIGGIGT